MIDNSEYIDPNRRRPLIIVYPGGGYSWRSPRGAEPIAIRMNALGFHACVLDYSIAPMDYPIAFLDLCEAVAYIRGHCDEWFVDPENVIVFGFSAAGHLAANFGVLWNKDFIQKYVPLTPAQIRPDALCLCYPIITSGKFRHDDSIRCLLGSQADDQNMRDFVSLEKHVNNDISSVFMWQTYEYELVLVENSLLFATELKKHNIPLEYHIFTKGLHGLSLANEETAGDPPLIQKECVIWPEIFAAWVRSGVIAESKKK